MSAQREHTIAILGLGYVGLPLAVAFSKKYKTLGFDINAEKATLIASGVDPTNELVGDQLSHALQSHLQITAQPALLASCNTYIITVPTDINPDKSPNLEPLIAASNLVGTYLKKGDLVIYESTTYPGCTEEVCVPILSEKSGLVFNQGYTVGYSPERINPGDKEHRVTNIKKVTSGSTPEITDFVDALYNEIITAGTHKAESIKIAEAAKVIENTQRDLNIALINELAIIFNRMGIDTQAVLEAAGSKWNFFPFRPGLVGGHCIGVDPYYLTHKAESIGYRPQIILAGRHLNDGMGAYVVSQLINAMDSKSIQIEGAKVLVMGLTFKENCPDLRNTRVVDIVHELEQYKCHVDIYDPWVDRQEAQHEYGITPVEAPNQGNYDAVILTVAHDKTKEMGARQIRTFCKETHVLYDLKYIFAKNETDLRL